MLHIVWLKMENSLEHLMLDEPACVWNPAEVEAKKLMVEAFKSALTQQQQQHLMSELNKNPKLVYHIGLTPNKVGRSIGTTR